MEGERSPAVDAACAPAGARKQSWLMADDRCKHYGGYIRMGLDQVDYMYRAVGPSRCPLRIGHSRGSWRTGMVVALMVIMTALTTGVSLCGALPLPQAEPVATLGATPAAGPALIQTQPLYSQGLKVLPRHRLQARLGSELGTASQLRALQPLSDHGAAYASGAPMLPGSALIETADQHRIPNPQQLQQRAQAVRDVRACVFGASACLT